MNFPCLFAVILSLFCQAGLAGQNYSPLSIENVKSGDGHRIVARNSGPAPVSVMVSIVDSMYIATDQAFPVYAVVPPGSDAYELGQIRPAITGVGYTFRTKYTWIMGDFRARQAADALYRLPYRDGTSLRIGQAPGGPITTHLEPDSQYAVDIPMAEGTPIIAARAGTVIHTEASHVDGALIPAMKGKANAIRILHADGTMASYAHLVYGGVQVAVGQRVAAGEQIGLAGSTGYSSGPHLHFSVQTIQRNGDKLETISLPFNFYVGQPAVAFAPRSGMLATADYASPGAIPGFATSGRTRLAQSPAAAPAPPTVGDRNSSPDALVAPAAPGKVRSVLLKVPAWLWFIGLLSIVWLLLKLDDWRLDRPQRRVRPTTFRSRPAPEPIFHGLSARDRLIVACGSDRVQADRLIEQEYRLAPTISAEEAAHQAWLRRQGGRQ